MLRHHLWPAPETFMQRFSTSQIASRLRQIRFLQPLIPEPQKPSIERLKGGNLNHITSIMLPSSYTQEERNLILSVPRWNQKRLDREVATSEYLRQIKSIPVATVAATDLSTNNSFEKPCMLQHRIPGNDMNMMWDSLSHSKRSTVAIEMGRVVRTLLSTGSPLSGLLETDATDSEIPDSFHVVPLNLDIDLDDLSDETKDKVSIDPTVPRAGQTTLDVFKSQFERWRTVALAHSCGEMNTEVRLLDDMLQAVSELNDLGFFKANWNR